MSHISRDLEVGYLFIHKVQWALTFPNLRRHLMLCQFNIKLVNVSLKLHYIPRFVPSAKGFLCTVFVFFDCQQNNLYQPVSPICLVASTLWCVNQYVRVLLYESFFHSGIINWPANLRCWNALPGDDVLTMPV